MKKIRIITHNGKFHADDVCAVAVLRIWLEKFGVKNIFGKTKIEIIRTRDFNSIIEGDFVVDVGGIYNAEKLQFDHHQNGLEKRPNGIPYAAFGLVWKTYGEKICGSRTVAIEIDEKITQSIDALDNGVEIYASPVADVQPYLFADAIDTFNFVMQTKSKTADQNFSEAVDFAKKILEKEIAKTGREIEERALIEEIYKKTDDKRIIIFDEYYSDCAWQKTLRQYAEPLFIVRQSRENGDWRVQALGKKSGSFENRQNLPADWAGKTGTELVKITGVADAVFCHSGLFVAVAKTKEGAVELARLAMGE
ncbi:MAG: MYG1 family protein [Patescibacteria group bacterium]